VGDGAPWTAAGGTRRRGTVVGFDEGRGVGVVADEDGRRYPFHCTAIADGSRTIAEGTRVCFVVAPGHLGRLEADGLEPTG
jgi:cold shock CspA family protein